MTIADWVKKSAEGVNNEDQTLNQHSDQEFCAGQTFPKYPFTKLQRTFAAFNQEAEINRKTCSSAETIVNMMLN